MVSRDTYGTGGAGREDAEPLGRAAQETENAGQKSAGIARERARALFEQQTHKAAERLDGVAHALHEAARKLDEENQGTAAHYAHQAASRVDRVAETLRESSVDDLVGQVETIARRWPEAFVGGAFAVGFLFARFVKSTGERTHHERSVRRSGQPASVYRGQAYGSASPYAGPGSSPHASSSPYAEPRTGIRDAAEMMAGGSPQPIRAGSNPFRSGTVVDETLGPVPATGTRSQESLP